MNKIDVIVIDEEKCQFQMHSRKQNSPSQNQLQSRNVNYTFSGLDIYLSNVKSFYNEFKKRSDKFLAKDRAVNYIKYFGKLVEDIGIDLKNGDIARNEKIILEMEKCMNLFCPFMDGKIAQISELEIFIPDFLLTCGIEHPKDSVSVCVETVRKYFAKEKMNFLGYKEKWQKEMEKEIAKQLKNIEDKKDGVVLYIFDKKYPAHKWGYNTVLPFLYKGKIYQFKKQKGEWVKYVPKPKYE